MALFGLVAYSGTAHALSTAASFDLSYGIANLSIVSLNTSGTK